MSRGKHAPPPARIAGRRRQVLAGLAAGAVVLGASFAAGPGASAATTSRVVPGTTGTAPAAARAHSARPAAQADAGGLAPFATAAGKVYMSEDGIGIGPADTAGGPVLAQKRDAGVTVQAAYLLAAGVPGYTVANGDVALDGKPLSFPAANSVFNDLAGTDGPVNSVWTDVTSIVRPVVDTAPAGNVSFTVTEPNTTDEADNIDGEILAVIMQDPALPTDNTVSLEFGALKATGDNYSIGLAQPLNLANKNLALTMSIGDSWSYQGQEVPQDSDISVDGTRLTSSAGGNDDSICKYDTPPDFTACGNGELITVGGVGDSPANPPDPAGGDADCEAGPPRCDDELYDLLPFVHNGDTSITVSTDNPSQDDNIFFTGFELDSAIAVVGQGATLSPATGTSPVGAPYTLTTRVQDDDGNPVASKAVTFTVLSGPDAGTAGDATTDAAGSASFTYSGKAAGQDVVQVSFTDANGAPEKSNTATVSWASAAAATTVATSLSGGGKAGAKISVVAGTAVTDGATLAGANAATATGTVTYTAYSNAACTTVAKAAGAVTVAGGAAPRSAAVALPAGTYYWKAAYSGDARDKASASTCGAAGEVETVTPAPPGTAITTALAGDAQTGARISLPAGQPAVDTATLTGKNAATATGTVTYRVYSDAACTRLVATAGTGTVTKGKPASSSAETLAAGTYYWRASYSGNSANLGSTSACGGEVLTVRKPAGTPGTAPSIASITTAWSATAATAHVTTPVAGDLLVAFVAGNGPAAGRQSATVSGGGLTWYLISRQDPAGSDTEIWAAIPAGPLSNAAITVTGAVKGYDETLTLLSYQNASGIGPEAFAAGTGAPHVALTTPAANSWVFAVGADWKRYAAHAAGSGQGILAQLNAPGGRTVWVQSLRAATPAAGTSVPVSDTSPATDPYDLLAVAVQ
ncbi:MAG TPA: Ig-like domain-containing protein [Trebonia sp.]|jgi:hypothetical protein|nr:Ig-like domain-containing protein [Trebonia sp.]